MHLMGRHVPAPDDTPAGRHPNPKFWAVTFGLNSRAKSEQVGEECINHDLPFVAFDYNLVHCDLLGIRS